MCGYVIYILNIYMWVIIYTGNFVSVSFQMKVNYGYLSSIVIFFVIKITENCIIFINFYIIFVKILISE